MSPDEVTCLLQSVEEGGSAQQLLELVYDQLRRIAQQRMMEERAGHTLQATALVHEAYLRLVGGQRLTWANRRHFFSAAAVAMRRILIEHARKRGRSKRRGHNIHISLDAVEIATGPNPDTFLVLNDAIRRLGERDNRAAEIVRLRFFAGLDIDQTAKVLDISPMTVKREWKFARTWLYGELRDDSG
jgi:RNA polymerase sigma factor (TIGR02999 family)